MQLDNWTRSWIMTTTLRPISVSSRSVQIEASHQFRVRRTRSNCETNACSEQLIVAPSYSLIRSIPEWGRRNKQPVRVTWTIVTRCYQKRWNSLFERSMFLLTIFACVRLYYICRIGRINSGDDEGKSKAKIWMIYGDDEEILTKPLPVDFTKLLTRTVTCLLLRKVCIAIMIKYLRFNSAANVCASKI